MISATPAAPAGGGSAVSGGVRLLAVSHTALQSGAERVLERVLAAAVGRGWQVTCAVPDGPLSLALRAAGVRTVRLPDLKLPGGRRSLAATWLLARNVAASRVLRRESMDADVLLVNGLLALPAVRLARVRQPVVWHVHDVVGRGRVRALLRLVRDAVGLAVGVSDAAARPVRALGLRTVVVPNGTPWPVAAAPDPRLQEGVPVIGCAGLLTSWKGQDVLLEAAALLPQIHVELAGGSFPKDGPFLKQLVERAARPDLLGRVRFLGPMPDVLERMRGWSVLVNPSVEPETGPLVVLEAMSVGLPVVASAHGGPLEFVQDAGVLVPAGDVQTLARTLDTLLSDPEERARLGANGRRQVQRDLQLNSRLQELLDVLQSEVGT